MYFFIQHYISLECLFKGNPTFFDLNRSLSSGSMSLPW